MGPPLTVGCNRQKKLQRARHILLCGLKLISLHACTHAPLNPYESSDPLTRATYEEVRLPFAQGTSTRVSQGAFGHSTHREPGFEYSWDFEVPYGTPVLSVKDGKITQVWKPSGGGGCDPKYSDAAHNVKVLHTDGTVAQYVHVEARVRIGESVRAGQTIAVTGNNGYLCSPHLHFNLFQGEKNIPENGLARTIPVRFRGIEGGIAKEGMLVKVPEQILLQIGWDAEGYSTPEWADAIRDRHPQEVILRIQKSATSPSATESAWLEEIRSVSNAWIETTDALRRPFPTPPPLTPLNILIGMNGGDDGFTCGRDTICMDLSAWTRAYGTPGTPEDRARIHRILSHEYTHLLTQDWLRANRAKTQTPFERAVLELYYEGLGNYHSLSSRWITPEGQLTPHAEATIEKHAPLLVSRLTALAALQPDDLQEEARLRNGLSAEPFAEKWGSTPVALWIAREVADDPEAFADVVSAGPEGVLSLLKRNLPTRLRSRLKFLPE